MLGIEASQFHFVIKINKTIPHMSEWSAGRCSTETRRCQQGYPAASGGNENTRED